VFTPVLGFSGVKSYISALKVSEQQAFIIAVNEIAQQKTSATVYTEDR
jgi:uncharacterized protein YukJ